MVLTPINSDGGNDRAIYTPGTPESEAFKLLRDDTMSKRHTILLVADCIVEGIFKFSLFKTVAPWTPDADVRLRENSILTEFFERCPATRMEKMQHVPGVDASTELNIYIRIEDLMFLRMMYS